MNTGLDPEFLTLNTDGYIVPASYFLEGPKRDANGALNEISYDNAAVEIRPKESQNLSELTSNTEALLYEARVLMRLARKRKQVPSGSELSLVPAAKLHPASKHIKSVSTFGCSPSSTVLDDYSSCTTVLRGKAGNTTSRSAGFHIHNELSYYDTVQPAVAVLDGLLGLKDVMVNGRYGWKDAADIRRNELGYGRAGEHRVRMVESNAFVLEYRVMSPWPLGSAATILWATATMKAVCEVPLETLLTVLEKFPRRARITEAINTNNRAYAMFLHKLCANEWADRRDPNAKL